VNETGQLVGVVMTQHVLLLHFETMLPQPTIALISKPVIEINSPRNEIAPVPPLTIFFASSVLRFQLSAYESGCLSSKITYD
jgi:hypothetical protein